jgi:hypothetical protein
MAQSTMMDAIWSSSAVIGSNVIGTPSKEKMLKHEEHEEHQERSEVKLLPSWCSL